MSTNESDALQDSRSIEERARDMGWYPEEEFRGDKSKWVDAETYVRKGEEFIPFIKADKRRLEKQVQELQSKLSEQERLIRATNNALAQLEAANNEQTRANALKAKGEIIQGIAEARKDGDVSKEIALTEQLDETNARIKAAVKEPPKQEPTTVVQTQEATQTPEFKQFLRDNPWFETDPVMRAASVAISAELARAGRYDGLDINERYALMVRETKKRFNVRDNPRRDEEAAVGNPSGAAGGSAGAAATTMGYKDLPPEAKAACDKLASRFVGENKKHKTIESWRKEYSNTYFEG